MGYLQLPDSQIDMSKVVISFWFRVPQSTVGRVTNIPPWDYGYSSPATWPVFQRILSLLAWGDQPQGTIYSWEQRLVGYDTPIGTPFYALYPSLSQTGLMAPSYIGLDCGGTSNLATGNSNPVSLVVNLQSSIKPTVTWNEIALESHNVNSEGQEVAIYGDVSFINEGAPVTIGDVAAPNIVPDQWHHVLLSWDVSGSESATGPVGTSYLGGPLEDLPSTIPSSNLKMFFALDDVNYVGNDLPATWVGSVDLNQIVSNDSIMNPPRRAVINANSTVAFEDVNYKVNATPSGTYQATLGALPARNLYVPGSPSYMDDRGTINSIYKVEMSELQIFTGVTLDTGIEANRRLFIKPDKKGVLYPVNPSLVTNIPIATIAIGDPTTWEPGSDAPAYTSPPQATDQRTIGSGNKTLGKPVVDFTKSNQNWIQGRNLGSASGKVVKTGKIKAYSPDPSITPGG